MSNEACSDNHCINTLVLSRCLHIYIALKQLQRRRTKTFWSHTRQKKSIWTERVADELFSFSIIHCGDSDIFLPHWSLHPVLHLRTSGNMPRVALSSPLHFHAFSPSAFPLPPYQPRLSSTTGHKSTAPTASRSWSVSLVRSPWPCSLRVTPPRPSPICCSGLCSAALSSMSDQKRTLIPISLLSVEYTVWRHAAIDIQSPAFANSRPPSSSPRPCDVSASKYMFHVTPMHCPILTLSVKKKCSERQRPMTHDTSHIQLQMHKY